MLKKIIIFFIFVLIIFILGKVFLFSEIPVTEFSIPEKEVHPPEPEDKSVLLEVPFVVQAPFGEWDNPIFQDACEEAALIMAMGWVERQQITSQEARAEIQAISDFQLENYGEYRDRSSSDTAQLMKDYYGYQNIRVKHDITIEDIKSELRKGNLVIVPVNGQLVKNPYYTLPGPERHMLVIIGYDSQTKEFITNDSGTRHGKSYHYSVERVYNSVRDYETGYHIPIIEIQKTMIVVERV